MLHEVELFVLGAGVGAVLSALFDLFRALRKTKVHPAWAVALEDFLFWLAASISLFLLIQIYNKGVIRFYIFLGCGIGAACYFLTITKLLFPMFLAFFRVLGWILSKCCLIFEIILKIIKNLLILPLKKILESIKMIYNNI